MLLYSVDLKNIYSFIILERAFFFFLSSLSILVKNLPSLRHPRASVSERRISSLFEKRHRLLFLIHNYGSTEFQVAKEIIDRILYCIAEIVKISILLLWMEGWPSGRWHRTWNAAGDEPRRFESSPLRHTWNGESEQSSLFLSSLNLISCFLEVFMD